MKKRTVALMLCAMMAFGAAGCGAKDADPAATEATESVPGRNARTVRAAVILWKTMIRIKDVSAAMETLIEDEIPNFPERAAEESSGGRGTGE